MYLVTRACYPGSDLFGLPAQLAVVPLGSGQSLQEFGEAIRWLKKGDCPLPLWSANFGYLWEGYEVMSLDGLPLLAVEILEGGRDFALFSSYERGLLGPVIQGLDRLKFSQSWVELDPDGTMTFRALLSETGGVGLDTSGLSFESLLERVRASDFVKEER